MRIGIDAHIVLPEHKRYDARIASYTEKVILGLIEADKKHEHTWVLFFDDRMKDTKKFQAPNVEIKHFPFVQYRKYMPVAYSHMLISGFLTAAGLDVFHSPEGLIPFMYPGNIVTTFHYVPRGATEGNLFSRTFMLGARAAFAQLCKRARCIIVHKPSDKVLLEERHGYPGDRTAVLEVDDLNQVDWNKYIGGLMGIYAGMMPKPKKAVTKKAAKK
ncbi:MAG: hypothetical protein HYZ63_00420 [Candidatus Andersenbacteria bacterium]|nr:hypothetical protein [Candidatus Andersenbacteria bacterium]